MDMSLDPDLPLIVDIRKAAGLVARGIVTASEFVGKVYHEFAHAETVSPEAIRSLWASVPASVLAEFTSAMRAAVSPDFQWRPLYFGPGPSEAERAEGTRQIRVWAEAMLRSYYSQPGPTA